MSLIFGDVIHMSASVFVCKPRCNCMLEAIHSQLYLAMLKIQKQFYVNFQKQLAFYYFKCTFQEAIFEVL